MKKIILVLLSVAIVMVSFAGCGWETAYCLYCQEETKCKMVDVGGTEVSMCKNCLDELINQ